ncbi:hypothetical protein LCGC14_1463510 [marine sediment metagenome]|uniref:Uncharacterized protein n=1 Tax=marine sediment metagenome TaxID=412755 RepID=A0A0F9MGC6_9ZZZZ
MSNEIDRYGKWTKEGLQKKIKLQVETTQEINDQLKDTLKQINELADKLIMKDLSKLTMPGLKELQININKLASQIKELSK